MFRFVWLRVPFVMLSEAKDLPGLRRMSGRSFASLRVAQDDRVVDGFSMTATIRHARCYGSLVTWSRFQALTPTGGFARTGSHG